MINKLFIPVIILTFVFFACGTTKTVLNTPPFKFVSASLAKDVKYEKPLNETDRFSPDDQQVIAHVYLENLSGTHTLQWIWFRPDGSIYYSTPPTKINTQYNKYRKEVNTWHKLSIKGDAAAKLEGEWKVDIIYDNQLLKSIDFKIEENIETLPVTAQKLDQKNWALIIGIEDYQHLPNVPYAKNDAQLVEKYFERVLGVPTENIILLLDDKATKTSIQGTIREFIPRNIENDSTLYVYYAGHGLPDPEEKDAYILPYDGNTSYFKTSGYKLQEFYDDINKLEVNRTYVFLDTCFSGATARGNETLFEGARILTLVEPLKPQSDKIVSFSASGGGEISGSYPEKKHGLFTYFLLSGLKGKADQNNDGSIINKELYNYINKNVRKLAARQGRTQTPDISPDLNSVSGVAELQISKVLE